MNSNYLCKKCKFQTPRFSNIQSHLNKQKSCLKNLEAYSFSEDQLLILSLLPTENTKNTQTNEINVEYLNNSELINNNKKELFNILDNINKNNL